MIKENEAVTLATHNDVSLPNDRGVFHIGDIIVHWNYGPGTIVAIEEKTIEGVTQQYYVVEVEGLKLWVPVEEAGVSSLRFPTERLKFEKFFDILRAPGQPLPDNQYQRRLEIRDRMQKKTLPDLCHLIRDLADRSRKCTLNQNDTAVLTRAEDLLLDEWVRSLDVNRSNAHDELEALLQEVY